MGPKKEPQRNAYYFLMIDYRNEQKGRGRNISMGQAAEEVKDIWPSLDEADRDRYRQMADDYKNQKGDVKYNSLGTPLSAIDSNQLQKEEAKLTMDRIISDTIRHLQFDTTLRTKQFHVIHVNYFVETDEHVYIPAEVAIAKFNLQEGIIDTFHRFLVVRPGSLPCGYRFKAIEYVNNTHKTPFDLEYGEDNMSRLLNDIKKFLKPEGRTGELPPLYTMPDNINTNTSCSAVKCMLENLCFNYDENIKTFSIYFLAKLFYELRNACARSQTFPSQTIAEGELDKDVYNYTKGIACTYHEEEDVMQFCSLSTVQRWVYLICDHCCHDLDIPLQPGYHCPQTADVEAGYRNVWRKSHDTKDSDDDVEDERKKVVVSKPVTFVRAVELEPQSKIVSSSQGRPRQRPRQAVPSVTDTWSNAVNHGNEAAALPPSLNDNNFPTISGFGRGRNPVSNHGPQIDYSAWSGRGRGAVSKGEPTNQPWGRKRM